MKAFELAELMAQQQVEQRPYLEFIRKNSFSLGLYTLPTGAVDRQTPHDEDEVYYVVSGRGVINVDGEDRAVQAGSIIFVAASVEHYFHFIQEDLVVIVFFAPPES